jgi:N6-L-threonylcarbamoyladenine synthase
MIILGIETSCDETAVALMDSKKPYPHCIIDQVIHSQIADHQHFGGVVPELAARQHLVHLPSIFHALMQRSGCHLKDIDVVGVTAGPGLIGGVLVGVMFAKGLCLGLNRPLYAVNHLEAHSLTVRLCESVDFPYLLLLVSGGHCQFLLIEGVRQYKILGQTLDDAAGETFDKVAKMLGFSYPGGVHIEQHARNGDPKRFHFPRPMVGEKGCDLSFSGLKNALRTTIAQHKNLSDQDRFDMAASFQEAIVETLVARSLRALDLVGGTIPFVISGGVASNMMLRGRLESICSARGCPFYCPPISLCTDNAIMVAWSTHELIKSGVKASDFFFEPLPSWPLNTLV